MKILSRIRNSRLRGTRSFTLVELIFEITVLAIVIIPTAILLVQLALDIVQTETNSIATALCVQKSEEVMRAYTFSTIGAVIPNGTFPNPYENYSFNITVECVNSNNPNLTEVCTSASNYKRVTIQVSNAGIVNPVVASLLFTKDVI